MYAIEYFDELDVFQVFKIKTKTLSPPTSLKSRVENIGHGVVEYALPAKKFFVRWRCMGQLKTTTVGRRIREDILLQFP
jgi:hypothetical protein